MLNLLHLAGRQIVPNAQATLAAAKAGLLKRLLVLHSCNTRESAGPARQFFQLVLELGDLIDGVEPVLAEVDETAQSVYHTALEVLNEPSEHRWVLHATGGTKLMSTGLMLLARHPRVAAVVYRDLHQGWFRFQLDAQGRPVDSPIAANCPELGWLRSEQVRVSSWPLLDVLHSQLGVHDLEAGSRSLPQGIQAAQWLAWGSKQRPGSFHRYAGVDKLKLEEGNAFEALLALILKEAGCEQVLWSVEFTARDGSKLLESDVVACHGDKLVLFDVKIQSGNWAREKSGQIRNAAKTAETLGGLGARAVLVRPNWPDSPAVGQMASALGVPLIRRPQVAHLVDELLRPLKLEHARSPVLDEIRRLFQQHARSCGKDAFQHSSNQRVKPAAR
jgi:hypothetical protein